MGAEKFVGPEPAESGFVGESVAHRVRSPAAHQNGYNSFVFIALREILLFCRGFFFCGLQ